MLLAIAKGLGNLAFGMTLVLASLFVLGLMARLFVIVFCFGYGCTT